MVNSKEINKGIISKDGIIQVINYSMFYILCMIFSLARQHNRDGVRLHQGSRLNGNEFLSQIVMICKLFL